MQQHNKTADVASEAAASPLPSPQITPKPAPGLRGPKGLSPRANFSRVNTGSPMSADAGAEAQKSMPPMGAAMLPKLASEASMTIAVRPTLQQMIKAAMTEGVERANVTVEATRQMENLGEKTAETYTSPEVITTDHALKLAAALEYGVAELKKQASGGSASKVQPGQGPGAQTVMQAKAEGQISEDMGQATSKNQPPMHPGVQSARGEQATQMANDYARAPGGSEKMIQKNAAPLELMRELAKSAAEEKDANFPGLAALKGKVVNAPRPSVAALKAPAVPPRPTPKVAAAQADNLVDYLTQASKEAEDAINPAKISSGAAVAPQTSAAGESGGAPAGGMPKGPRQLVHSTESATNYTRRQAYANRKEDMSKYVSEPMMSAATDKALSNAWSHTAQAGAKIASAEAMRTAAGRALLAKLAEEAAAKKDEKKDDKKHEKDSNALCA